MTISLEEIKKKKNLGKYKEALDSIRLFLKQELLDDNLRFEAEKLKIVILAITEQLNESLELCKNLLERIEKSENKSQIAEILLIKSEILLELEDFDKYHKTIEIAKKIIDEEIETDSYDYKKLTGYLFYLKSEFLWKNEEYEESLNYLEQSLKLFESIEEKEEVCKALRELCINCFWLGQADKGIEYGNYALKILADIKILPVKMDIFESMSLLYITKGDYSIALEYSCKTSTLAKELNFEFIYLGENKINESWIHCLLGNWEKAEKLASEGLAYVKEKGSDWWSFFGNLFLSNIYFQTGKTAKALDHILEGLQIAKKLGNKTLQCLAYMMSANVYYRLGEIDKALENIKKSLDLSEVYKSPFSKARILSSVIMIYLDKNDILQAESYLKIFKKLYEEHQATADIKPRFHFSEASFLMKSSDPRERGKAEVLFEQLVDDKGIEFHIRVFSLFNLCVLLLTEFQLSGDIKIIDQLNKYLNRLLDIAEEKKLSYLLIEIYILQSKIASIKMATEEAHELLIKAQKLAEEQELSEQIPQILEEQELLKNHLDAWRELIRRDAPVQYRIKDVNIEKTINSMKKQITSHLFEDSRTDPASLKKLFVLKI
ncbi:MAG: tetratricopeptide repeat protein [Candidatus Heimdallarchaeota archaeon]|nr:tetratricopeptide repeat protein [Candidatus Heimdallarchaeota archaeon]